MSVEHVYRVAQSGWLHCNGSSVQEVPAWPRLPHSALVVLDYDDVYSDVWRFEGKTDYAAALVEKRVRTQGLVDGAAHIVVHRLLKSPGGFQVFFSAVSLELWQRCTQWANEQSDHCLVMLAPGLLCHGVGNGGARLSLSQRRLMCFVQNDSGMAFSETHALGSGAASMASAAQLIAANQSAVLSPLAPDAVEWATLWSTESADVDTCVAAVRGVLGGAPRIVPTQDLALLGERVQTVLPTLARKAAGSHAVNPGFEKLAWRAERWVVPVAALTAVVGVLLGTMGVLVGQMADQQQLATQSPRAELAKLQERIQAVSQIEAPQKLLPIAEFSRALDEGARHDPVAFLALLKTTAGKGIHIQRVRLDAPSAQVKTRSFRVDGVMDLGASASVTRWVSAMTAAGWTLKAVDPTYQGPGAFSYELVATAASAGIVKP